MLAYFILEYAMIAYQGLFINRFLVQKLLFWTPLVYVIAFLLFRSKTALFFIFGVFVHFACHRGAYLITTSGKREFFDAFLFMQVFLASLIYIALLIPLHFSILG